jgi:phage terminase large subunit
MGGAGSGKSVFIAQKILFRILKAASEGRSHNFLCLRKIKATARGSIFKLFCELISEWGLSPKTKINKTDMTITLFSSTPFASYIYCTGLDDPEKIKSVHGISSEWLEEVTEFTEDDFMQLDLRLRGVLPDYKQIIASFNPIDEAHWIRQNQFGDELQAKIEGGQKTVRRKITVIVDGEKVTFHMTVMHSVYKDNEYIDKMYKAQLESLAKRDKNFYNIYCLGWWGSLKGLIFDKWEKTNKWPSRPDDHAYGLDFGFSIDPSAGVEIAFEGKDLYLREVLYEKGLTNPDIASRMLPIVGYTPIIADSAEPKSIVELRQKGLTVIPAVKGPDSILYGIQTVKQYNIYIDENSPNLIKEFSSYKWAEKKDGTLLRKPVDYLNHLIDAVRYGVTHLKGRVKAGVEIIGEEQREQRFDPGMFVDEMVIDENDPALWSDMV